MSAVGTQNCYRHPSRETAVSCSSCGQPICPDCMTPTPVGMRCPDCSKQRTTVRSMASLRPDPTLTYVLIGISVVAFLGQMSGGSATSSGSAVFREGALYGPLVANGEWYRLITGGFLHGGLLHLAFNMYFLFVLGQMMEPAIGRVKFGALYAVSLFGGSLGVMLLSPNSPTVGASGAVFGLLGAAVLVERSQGIGLMQSSLGMTMLLNLGITFLIPGISIGGHLGGLAVGAAAGWVLLIWAPKQRFKQADSIALGIIAAMAVAAVTLSLVAAERGADQLVVLTG